MTRPRNSNSDMDNLNKDSRAAAVPVGYVDEDGGEVVALQGDADAPYVIAHGRASSDGSTGLVAEQNGAAQRLALSPLGHAWSDLYVDGAPVSALNPLPTAGAAAGTTDTNIIEVAGTPVVVTTPGVLLVDVNNFPAGGATDITAIAGTPVVVTTPGVLSVDVLNFPAGGATDITAIDGAPLAAHTAGELPVQVMNTVAENLTQIASVAIAAVTTPGSLPVQVLNFPASTATDITKIDGAALAAHTAGELPVQVMNTVAENLTHIAGVAIAAVTTPGSLPVQVLNAISATENLTQINGVAVAVVTAGHLPVEVTNTVAENITKIDGAALAAHTAGVLPVELVSTVWTKSIGSLGVNGDILIVAGPPAGRIQRITISIFSGSGWLYICDKAALPPTFATLNFPPIPFLTATLASPSYIDITFEDVGGLKYAALGGIVIGVSTTGPSPYTAPGANVATGVVTVYYV